MDHIGLSLLQIVCPVQIALGYWRSVLMMKSASGDLLRINLLPMGLLLGDEPFMKQLDLRGIDRFFSELLPVCTEIRLFYAVIQVDLVAYKR